MAHPALITINIIISIFAIFLIIIYVVNKNFRSYPCYFNIIFSSTIALDNLIRLLPAGTGNGNNNEPKTLACYIQAFNLTLFDKLILTLMTVYSIIAYLGSNHLHFYKSNEKLIFIALTVISIVISLITTILFSLGGISNRSEYCYVETKNNIKKIIDTIITAFLFLINLFCIIVLLKQIQKIRKERQDDTEYEEEKKSLNYHFIRFIINLIVNCFTFAYVLILINKILPFDNFVKDLLFIVFCLIVELFFVMSNTELMKEIKRIITCNQANEVESDNTIIPDRLNEE